MRECFDSEKYLKLQKAEIRKRIRMFDKLYLEFGGKLADDNHAARVLPGFLPDLKIRLLQEFKDELEVVLCVNANDIERNRVRADRVISYGTEVFRLIEFLRERGIAVDNVVITLYDGQPRVAEFRRALKKYKVKTYVHRFTKGYPTDVDTIVSDEGYGANPYIETTRKVVVISAPGASSGKLATALSQLYHEYKQGVKAGYAKLETFPVWDLALKHPVNMAYEAATADIGDRNMIDNFHLEKYGKGAVNYNRDLETFPILREILRRIVGEDIYFSPTDMGVNVVGQCITDNAGAEKAAKDEILRRYFKALVKAGRGDEEVDEDAGVGTTEAERIRLLMNELGISEADRKVIAAAEKKRKQSGAPSAAMEIEGEFVSGRRTGCLSPISSTVINGLKMMTGIPDGMDLIAGNVLEPILKVRNRTANFEANCLDLGTVLVALSICSTTNPMAARAIDSLDRLRGAELHATYMIPEGEMVVLGNLGVNASCVGEGE